MTLDLMNNAFNLSSQSASACLPIVLSASRNTQAMSLTIRPAKEEDADGLTEVYNDAILNTTALFVYDPVSRENRLSWLHELQAKQYPCLVAEVDGQFAGYCSLGPFNPKPAYDRCDNVNMILATFGLGSAGWTTSDAG